MPTMSTRPSGNSSATTATTFEVPISRAMIRFLLSLAMSDSLVRRGERHGPGRFRRAPGCVHGEAVGVAQVHVVGALPRLPQGLREDRDELREPVLDPVPLGVAPEVDREAVREP